MPGLPSPRVNIQQHLQQPQQYPGMGNIQQPQQHQSQQQQQQQQIQQQSQSRTTSQGYGGSGQQQSQQLQGHYSTPTTPMYGNGGVTTHDASGRLFSTSSNNSVSTSGMQRNSRPAPVSTSQPQSYRSSKTATINTSKSREPPGRSPQPTNVEANLTMQSSALISSTVQPYMAPLVGQRIQELVTSLDPSYSIDSQAQDQVLQLADDFLDKVCKQSLRLAAHRGSSILEVQDVQLVLAKQWGIVIPGLGPPLLNKSRVVPPSTKGNLMNNSSTHSTSGTKRKSTVSSKSSSGIVHSEKSQSLPNKESKQSD
jgi:transcription initiation factor TFIID subunit 12